MDKCSKCDGCIAAKDGCGLCSTCCANSLRHRVDVASAQLGQRSPNTCDKHGEEPSEDTKAKVHMSSHGRPDPPGRSRSRHHHHPRVLPAPHCVRECDPPSNAADPSDVIRDVTMEREARYSRPEVMQDRNLRLALLQYPDLLSGGKNPVSNSSMGFRCTSRLPEIPESRDIRSQGFEYVTPRDIEQILAENLSSSANRNATSNILSDMLSQERHHLGSDDVCTKPIVSHIDRVLLESLKPQQRPPFLTKTFAEALEDCNESNENCQKCKTCCHECDDYVTKDDLPPGETIDKFGRQIRCRENCPRYLAGRLCLFCQRGRCEENSEPICWTDGADRMVERELTPEFQIPIGMTSEEFVHARDQATQWEENPEPSLSNQSVIQPEFSHSSQHSRVSGDDLLPMIHTQAQSEERNPSEAVGMLFLESRASASVESISQLANGNEVARSEISTNQAPPFDPTRVVSSALKRSRVTSLDDVIETEGFGQAQTDGTEEEWIVSSMDNVLQAAPPIGHPTISSEDASGDENMKSKQHRRRKKNSKRGPKMGVLLAA